MVVQLDGAEDDDDDHHVDENQDDRKNLHLTQVDHWQMAIGHLSCVRSKEVKVLRCKMCMMEEG